MGPLDPAMKSILDRRNALNLPGFSAGTPQDARQGFAQSQASLTPDRGARDVTVRDETIPGPIGMIPIRRYAPKRPSKGRILYIHGGGWVFGTLDGFDPVCRQLAQGSGAEVISVDYRLAPEHSFPSPLDDCWAALCAIADATPVAVMGDSAGGNLAAALTLRARSKRGPEISLQLLLYPLLSSESERDSYARFGNGDYLISTDDIRWFWDHYLDDTDRRAPEAAPLYSRDLKGLPDAVIVLAGCDPLHDEGKAYAAALEADGVKVTLRVHPGMAHGFFTLVDILDAANEEVAAVSELIAQHFAKL